MSIRFTREHEWIRIDGDIGTVGVTEYAQQQLGDVVFVELPAVGAKLSRGGQAAVVESVKAASEVYSPASGEVTEINETLTGDPAAINRSPTEAGWIYKIRLTDLKELEGAMDQVAYATYVGTLH